MFSSVTFNVADNDNDPANEIQRLNYDAGTKTLSIDGANSVVITEDQTLNQVLVKGNSAGNQTISNLGAPVAANDASTKQYVDDTATSINSRISSNYAFKTGFTFTALLAVSEVTLPLAGESFDDFNVVNASGFTAQVAGTYMFVLDGTSTGLLASAGISLSYAGTKYPVTISGNGQYNSTFMFRLTAGQTVTVVATGLGIGSGVTGQFYGYKLL